MYVFGGELIPLVFKINHDYLFSCRCFFDLHKVPRNLFLFLVIVMHRISFTIPPSTQDMDGNVKDYFTLIFNYHTDIAT